VARLVYGIDNQRMWPHRGFSRRIYGRVIWDGSPWPQWFLSSRGDG
jgi:hypothetical protein